jgi:tetratricopeptide (TPR) repeat protein
VEAEEQWVQACEVFHAHYPRTLEFACCLCRLGVLYCSSKRLGFAEDLWLKALAILSVRPESLEMASCLNNLGAMYETQGRKQEAVQRTDESLRIYMKPRVSKQVTDIKLDYSGFEVNILYLAAIHPLTLHLHSQLLSNRVSTQVYSPLHSQGLSSIISIVISSRKTLAGFSAIGRLAQGR